MLFINKIHVCLNQFNLKSPGIHENSMIKELLYHLKPTSAAGKIRSQSGYDELFVIKFVVSVKKNIS